MIGVLVEMGKPTKKLLDLKQSDATLINFKFNDVISLEPNSIKLKDHIYAFSDGFLFLVQIKI